MSVVYKFNRAEVAGALATMGYAPAANGETSFNRVASLVLGHGIGGSSLQRAAVTIQHESSDRRARVGQFLDRNRHRTDVAEAKAAGERSAQRAGAKVSDRVRNALVAGAAGRKEHS